MPSTVADAIVSCLRCAGVRAIFGVPGGGGNLDVIAATGRAGLPFVLTATETAAAMAAIAQTEVTGAVGACLTGLGPGAASVVNGVACAALDRAPLIVITDAYPKAVRGRFLHQRIDHRALLAPLTKWSATVTSDNIGAVMDEAVARALTRPRGPVHLDCPADVAGLQAKVRSAKSEVRSPESSDFGLSTSDFGLRRRPLLLAGLGARNARDAAAIRAFCASHRLPAMVTYKAKGIISDADPHFAGVFTNGAIEREIIDRADLLIAVGLDDVELLPREWTFPQPVVPIDDDIAPRLGELARRLDPSEWDLATIRQAVEAQRARLRVDRATLTPDAVVRIAAAHAPGARVTVDAGAHMFPATLLWPVAQPAQMLISNGLSTMGFAVPAATGAGLLERDRAVVALVGDGGLLMSAGELLTLVRERLHVIVIVFDDASLSLIDVKQRQRGFERAGVEVGAVDWAQVAAGIGMAAHVAKTAGELADAMGQATAHEGPSLIDARIDPGPYADIIRMVRG